MVSFVRSRVRRYTAPVLVAVLGVGFFGASVPAHATPLFTFTRIAGADRYATSAEVAEEAFTSASTVILATGATYPDALAASFLAGNLGAPILLTTPSLPLSSATTSALVSLGAKSVIILGGSSAVSQAEQIALAQLPAAGGGVLSVSRISGATRYDTMQAIDTATSTTVGVFEGKRTAFLATGQDFPDALGAAPISYAERFPIILTQSNVLSAQAAQTLTTLGIQQVLILGGTAAISTNVEASVNAMGIPTLVRLAGLDRSATSVDVAEWAISNVGFKDTGIDVASGDEAFGGADALSVGPLGGRGQLATVVTDSVTNAGTLPSFAAQFTATLAAGTAIGGTGPLPDSLLALITSAAQTGTTSGSSSTGSTGPKGSTGVACGTAPSVGTSGATGEGGSGIIPELTSVSLVSLTTPAMSLAGSLPEGTTLAFHFGEAVTAGVTTPTDFILFNSNGGPSIPATTAQVQPGNVTVNAFYPTIDTQQLYDGLGLASVVPGAVQSEPTASDPTQTNPEASAPIGGHVQLVAGHTDAPDLTAFAGFRAGAVANEVMVDLTFNCDALPSVAGVNGYHIVLTDNFATTCTGPLPSNLNPNGGNAPGGVGTTVITVACPNPVDPNNPLFNGVPITQSEVARVYVDTDTVTDSVSGAMNPLESVGTNPTVGMFIAPDLTSATAQPDVLTPVPHDAVTFIFDQPVISIMPGSFDLFTQTGAEIIGAATSAATVIGAPNDVLVQYPVGTLTDVVGAYVPAAAVHGATGGDLANQPASFGVIGSTLVGATTAPDLVSASITSATTVVYTFDKPPVAPIVPADFLLYATTDGLTPVLPAATAVGAVPSGNTITATFGSTTGAFLATVKAGGAGNLAASGFTV